MMWQSKKALDLLRDARMTAATPQVHHNAPYGDLKLYGTAVDVPDERRRHAYGDATEAKIGWRPTGPFHLFALDIDSAGFISFGTDRRMMRWSLGRGVEKLAHPAAKKTES